MEKCGLNTNQSPYAAQAHACEGTTFCPSPPFLSASLLQSLLQKPGPCRLQPASHRYELSASSLTPVSGPRFAAELWATYGNYLTHLSPRSAELMPCEGPSDLWGKGGEAVLLLHCSDEQLWVLLQKTLQNFKEQASGHCSAPLDNMPLPCLFPCPSLLLPGTTSLHINPCCRMYFGGKQEETGCF